MKIMASGPITSWQIETKNVNSDRLYFLGGSDCSHEIKRCLLLRRKAVTNLERVLKSKDITLPTKSHLVEAMVFPVVMYGCELDHREGWLPKNWCFWIVVLEKILESLLDSKKIKLVNSKGDQPWIFIERADAETEASIYWPPDAKSRLIGKDPDTGKYWGQEEERMTENEMVGWHHQLIGDEFE